MKFDSFFTRHVIEHFLCKIRAGQAHQRSKRHSIHLLTSSKNHNYHLNTDENIGKIDDQIKLLNSLLPPRRKWRTLKKELRYKPGGQKINSIDYNLKSLLITINWYRQKAPNEPFLKRLDFFIDDIQRTINDPNLKIETPEIIPSLKDKKKENNNVCRPISLFQLKDRVIISLTNRYLTKFFDSIFYDKSFAFRALQKDTDGNFKSLSHHNAFLEIEKFKSNYKGKRLFVAECDISKFYDSLHHTVILQRFLKLVDKVEKQGKIKIDYRAIVIFKSYLDSYSFSKDVIKYNDHIKYSLYWEKHRIKDGSFGWVESELNNRKFFKSPRMAKIGVPQGGALSGIIANIVLDFADEKISLELNSKCLYVRFCDDMILITSSKRQCEKLSKVYSESLNELKLIGHPYSSKFKPSTKAFWKEKSKSPYKWSSNNVDQNWIGFVGYEMNYKGEIRVRRKSLIKEKEKQKKVVNDITSALKINKRKNDNQIIESALNRLVGMSVGRVTLKNFENLNHEMCWVKGFELLNNNPSLRKQLKGLDKSRSMQVSRLIKNISNYEIEPTKSKTQKISENYFTQIKGISFLKSKELRENLVRHSILTPGYRISKKLQIDLEYLEKVLSPDFLPFKGEIFYLLFENNHNAQVKIYGKPFSYFFQVLRNK